MISKCKGRRCTCEIKRKTGHFMRILHEVFYKRRINVKKTSFKLSARLPVCPPVTLSNMHIRLGLVVT